MLKIQLGWLAVGLALGGGGDAPRDVEVSPVQRALSGPLRHTRYLAFEVRSPHEAWRRNDGRENDRQAGARAQPGSLYHCRLDLRTGRREMVRESEDSVARHRSEQGGSGGGVGATEPSWFGAGLRVGLTFLHGQPVPGSTSWVAIAVPIGAVTREKGWLALVNPRALSGGAGSVRLLGAESGRLEHMLEANGALAADDAPIHVEHPEFRWRYPYPLDPDLFLVLSDHAIWVMDAAGRAEVLYEELQLEGELAWLEAPEEEDAKPAIGPVKNPG